MSKTDIVQTEYSFDLGGPKDESFHLYQSGDLNDMREWQFRGLEGPFWRLYHHNRSGSAIRVNRRLIPLRAQEIVLIPDHVRFDCRGAAGVAHYWIHFSPSLRVAFAPRVRRIPIGPSTAGLIREWRALVTSHPDAPMRRRLFHVCMAVLHACFAQVPISSPAIQSPALQRVLEEIEQSLSHPLDNGTLARRTGRSVEGFIRWFRAETGTTPARYVNGRRIRQAGRLLCLTDRSIEEVAESLGFSNRHHFTRVFTRHFGQPPAQFRGEQRQVG